MLSQEEKFIWDKMSEAYNVTILGNTKIPHKPSTHFKFNDVTLERLIKYIFHHFDFGDTHNGPPNNDIINKEHHTDNNGDTIMILTNISKRDNVST